MFGSLPVTIDPAQLAEKGTRLTGRVAARGMTRLQALMRYDLGDDAGEVDVDLIFEQVRSSALRRMHGHLAVAVKATCQRCLEPMNVELVAKPDVILLRQGESETALPPEADALTVGQTPVSLAELVEDELLLVMPMVPMHPLNECRSARSNK